MSCRTAYQSILEAGTAPSIMLASFLSTFRKPTMETLQIVPVVPGEKFQFSVETGDEQAHLSRDQDPSDVVTPPWVHKVQCPVEPLWYDGAS